MFVSTCRRNMRAIKIKTTIRIRIRIRDRYGVIRIESWALAILNETFLVIGVDARRE